MKTKILLTLIVMTILKLFNCATINSQCLTQGIQFITQEDVDSFLTNYPDCTEIMGNVSIGYVYPEVKSSQIESDIDDLTGLNTITSIHGSLIIHGTVDLVNLEGLENLTYIGGDLTIGGPTFPFNSSLVNLTGLINLDSIDGSLIITKNPALVNLSVLESLANIGGALKIGGGTIGWFLGNYSLTSLEGLDNLEAASIEGLVITYNSSLASCEVQSICEYLAAQNGEIEIHDNATGCGSQAEVEVACMTTGTIENLPLKNQVQIYPNPASQKITINSSYQIQEINIYNQIGQIVLQKTSPEPTLDISFLQPGIYFVKLKALTELSIEKLLIQ